MLRLSDKNWKANVNVTRLIAILIIQCPCTMLCWIQIQLKIQGLGNLVIILLLLCSQSRFWCQEYALCVGGSHITSC